MFEPAPAMLRRERERQGLTLEEVSRLAGISRSRLSALERGEENVSFALVLKVAHALQMKELYADGLRVIAAPADLTALLVAQEAIEAARRVIRQANSSESDLERSATRVSALLDRLLAPMPEIDISKTIARLTAAGTDAAEARTLARALHDMVETPEAGSRAARKTESAKGGARKRAR